VERDPSACTLEPKFFPGIPDLPPNPRVRKRVGRVEAEGNESVNGSEQKKVLGSGSAMDGL
jgi:hypothetical protein